MYNAFGTVPYGTTRLEIVEVVTRGSQTAPVLSIGVITPKLSLDSPRVVLSP